MKQKLPNQRLMFLGKYDVSEGCWPLVKAVQDGWRVVSMVNLFDERILIVLEPIQIAETIEK